MRISSSWKIKLALLVGICGMVLYQMVPTEQDSTKYGAITHSIKPNSVLKLSRSSMVSEPKKLPNVIASENLLNCLNEVVGRGDTRGKFRYYLLLGGENERVLMFAGNENLVDVMLGNFDKKTGAILGNYNSIFRLNCRPTSSFVNYLRNHSITKKEKVEDTEDKQMIGFELFE